MSTSAISVETTQINFIPSWMRVNSGGAGNCGGDGSLGNSTRNEKQISSENQHDYPLADPIFVTNRYGREDLLALQPKDSRPPDGLDACCFFIPITQQPIVLQAHSEIEERLQFNINSSKAMNALNHTERLVIGSGGSTIAQYGNIGHSGGGGQQFQSTYMVAGGGSGFGRGTVQSNRSASFRGGRGGVQSHSIPGNHGASGLLDSPILNRYVPSRSRGGMVSGRGGGIVGSLPLNSRAQGLYDPRDPNDRPRKSHRSISEDSPPVPNVNTTFNSNVTSGTSPTSMLIQNANSDEWVRVGHPGVSWGKRSLCGAVHQKSSSSAISGSTVPEWMGDASERGGALVSDTGSFDDGQFKINPVAKVAPNVIGAGGNDDSVERQKVHGMDSTGSSVVVLADAWTNSNEKADSHSSAVLHYQEPPEITTLLTAETKAPVVSSKPSNIYQSKNSNIGTIMHHPLAQSVSVTSSLSNSEDVWFYVDPKNAIQGPFATSHMQGWYDMGYFPKNLHIRYGRDPEKRFVTLDDLICWNGAVTPFKDYGLVPTVAEVVQMPMQPPQLNHTLWTDASFIDKVQEERQRLAEKERKLREQEEAMAKKEEERQKKWQQEIREKELLFQKQQEELRRMAAEEEEKAAAREREIENERRRMTEEIERAKKEKVERLLDEMRKEEAERRRLVEDEHKKAEKERMTLQIDAERKKAEEREAKKKPEKESSKQFEQKKLYDQTVFTVTESHAPVSIPENLCEHSSQIKTQTTYRVIDNKPVLTKVAPWLRMNSDSQHLHERCEQSLLEIQREEELQAMAESEKRRQQLDANRKENAGVAHSVWASASQKLTWNRPLKAVSQVHQSAWGAAGANFNSNITVNPLWNTLEMDKKLKTNNCFPKNAHITKSKGDCNAHQEAVKKLFKDSLSINNCPFTSWIIQRVNQLNSSVDADVFASFIQDVDNPDDVADYIDTYLGEGREAKEFLREFLDRRSQTRLKKYTTEKDDLSRPAVAADTLSTNVIAVGNSLSQQSNTSSGKKKKKGGRNNKCLVDGACLGFKSTADPNRVNIGEIDTIAPNVIDRSRR